MGLVETAHTADGTPLLLEMRGRMVPATVVPMPFWQKNYAR
jgi:aminomethyltransferase